MACEVCGSEHPDTTGYIVPGWAEPGEIGYPRYLCPSCADSEQAAPHWKVAEALKLAQKLTAGTERQVLVIVAAGNVVIQAERIPWEDQTIFTVTGGVVEPAA